MGSLSSDLPPTLHSTYVLQYRVTHILVQNLPLTSKEKFHFGLACPGLARPKRKFTFEVNGRFCTRRRVTRPVLFAQKMGKGAGD